ncbi:serine hydrolase, partial [Aquisalimonas sp.]|uniref:serine hydrolase domain-containing protein n=1 Tax=Aquisalimonas sp. TaxID=1872621 RepID=UPI0025C276BC
MSVVSIRPGRALVTVSGCSRWLVIALLSLVLACPAPVVSLAEETAGFTQQRDASVFRQVAERQERLRGVLVLINGEPVLEHVVRGPDLDTPVNIKSLSKTILAALVGMAVDRGYIRDVDQLVTELLGDRVPDDVNSRVHEITVGHLLSMQAGLKSTSGPNYGAWVSSDDWVAYVLRRPFVGEPGGRMRYSTGNSHLLSAALAEQTGQSTLALARAWLGEPLNIAIPDWLQ